VTNTGFGWNGRLIGAGLKSFEMGFRADLCRSGVQASVGNAADCVWVKGRLSFLFLIIVSAVQMG
jgi:hypothetical protein